MTADWVFGRYEKDRRAALVEKAIALMDEKLSQGYLDIEDNIPPIVDLIRAEVLEEAARVCDEHAARYEADIPDGDSNDGLAETVAASLRGRAAAIRALGAMKETE